METSFPPKTGVIFLMLHLRLGARQIANSDEVHPLLRVMVQSYLP